MIEDCLLLLFWELLEILLGIARRFWANIPGNA